ncbi:hypothetical protein BJY16_006662 [Actinoplanes octamycinicus]|uniref:DUF4240 domain-containing protein n=1 Tax=Actinoplanes octamycinicus TaxID=135948 RepID=A0A7W7H396_9ACTN|nr:DUF4240 domain-containing protein [Actinoplanes octamycinicus]MBB4743203.1 hypothetical protein [Actinoplanes octamycinicus]
MPTAAEEARFWELVESAWAGCGSEAARLRRALAERDPGGEGEEAFALEGWMEQFMARLGELCEGLSSAELTDLDRVVERKLFDIDREEIHEYTDGSDDGFLYCRGFIVAAGRQFYEAVRANPAMAVMDAEWEEMCYFFAHLHDKRFGGFPETGSGISRESGRNPEGW